MGGGVGYLLWSSYAVGTEIIWFPYSCRLCGWLNYYASVLSWQLSSHAKQAAEPRGIFANLTCSQSSRGSAAKEYNTCPLILSDAQAILSNDPGKVDSNFFCYAATVLSPHRNVLIFIQRMHKPT